MPVSKCVICGGKTKIKSTIYTSPFNLAGTDKPIQIKNAKLIECQNEDCEHTWMSSSEADRLKSLEQKLAWNKLSSQQLTLLRKSLPIFSKYELAQMLGLNEKAFSRWEKNTTSMSLVYDLLIRLVAFSERNFNFIKDLHAKNFRFDMVDYEYICKTHKHLNWTYTHQDLHSPKSTRSQMSKMASMKIVTSSSRNFKPMIGAQSYDRLQV